MSMTADRQRVVAETEGETVTVLGAPMVFKTDPAKDGLLLADHVVPPGYMVPPHVHAGEDEVFHILEGELTLITATGERRAGPGATAMLPGGVVHGFRNDTAAPVRFLVLVKPGLQAAEMFRHLDRAGRAAGAGGMKPEEVGAICQQYGVSFA